MKSIFLSAVHSSPWVEGLTPRQYQNPAGRRRVRELLKELEFIEERKGTGWRGAL